MIPVTVPGVIDSYRPAKHHRARRAGSRIRLFVVHVPVGPETPTYAEDLGRYFATTTRTASTHFGTDNNSAVRYVLDDRAAYAAGGANDDGLHVEISGRPEQTRAQWLDSYSRAAMARAANIYALANKAYGIPPRFLTYGQLRDRRTPGLTTHHDIVQALGIGDHWDPGPHFPKDHFAALCARAIEQPQTIEDDMQPISEWHRILRGAPDGLEHPAVEFAQLGLTSLGHDPGDIDSVLGPKTRGAWESWEESHGWPNADDQPGSAAWPIFLAEVFAARKTAAVPAHIAKKVDEARALIMKADAHLADVAGVVDG